MTVPLTAEQADHRSRRRQRQSGGILALRLPPPEFLPSAMRKAAKQVTAMEAVHHEAKQAVTRLEREEALLVQRHREGIADAFLSGKERPTDPMPGHLEALAAARDDEEGARLAHQSAVDALWAAVPDRSSKTVKPLIEDIVAKETAALEALVAVADLIGEIAVMKATLAFFDGAPKRKQFTVAIPPMVSALKGFAGEVSNDDA